MGTDKCPIKLFLGFLKYEAKFPEKISFFHQEVGRKQCITSITVVYPQIVFFEYTHK